MESVPAVFSGTVFAVFGAALLVWTASRVARREPVTLGAGPAATVLSVLFGVVFLLTGALCLQYV